MDIIKGSLVLLTIASALVTDTDAWTERNIFRNLWRRVSRLSRQRISRNTPPTPTTVNIPTTASRVVTTTPASCEPTYEYDPDTNWCSGTFCDESGQLIAWDTWNCRSTSTSTTPTSRPPGCEYKGQFYAPGSEIERGESRASNWCWVVYCGTDGNIIHGDDFNCFPTTTSTSTPQTPPMNP